MKYLFFLTLIFNFNLLFSQNSEKLDYSNPNYWAALPTVFDSADLTPPSLHDAQSTAEADVFFIHPTSYGGVKGNKPWNAKITYSQVNKKTDEFIIKNQATIFNDVGKIYAPRYRQAHFFAFLIKNKDKKQAALDFAYEDVKNAFEYYLKNYNNGRPIIIAAHSQGTLHAVRILHDFFENTNLKNRLVVAYLPGMPVSKTEFTTIPVCQNEYQTSCFCSWRTFEKGSETSWGKEIKDVAVTNPLAWTTTDELAPKELHKGMVLFNFDETPKEHAIEAQIHNGILWVNKPKFKGSQLIIKNNFHQGDYNLFYVNIRENARKRLNAFWKG